MKTCISENCPYIDICKHYNFSIDHENECSVRKKITELAKKEMQNSPARRDKREQ